jgi:hypothetical protein
MEHPMSEITEVAQRPVGTADGIQILEESL